MIQQTTCFILFSTIILSLCLRDTVASDPPEITRNPVNQRVRVGGVATFFCAARGDPLPSITWFRNGKRLSVTYSRFNVIESNGTSLLRIEPVAGHDDALYKCTAKNIVGVAGSAVATLNVYEADKAPAGFPVIEIQSNSHVIEIGHTAVLQCKASGSPTPKVHWLKDMKRVELTSKYTLLDGSLQISQSEEADQGKYECVAENTVGTEHSKPINLNETIRRFPPRISHFPNGYNEVLLGGNLSLSCEAVGSPMPFVKWRRGLDEDITPENELPVGKSVLQLSDIRSSVNYTCIASSSLGVYQALAIVKVISLPIAPTDLRILKVTATSVWLQWSYKGPEKWMYFIVQYNPKNAKNEYTRTSVTILEFSVVEGLSPDTEYEFYVIGVNKIGPISSVISAKTQQASEDP